MPDAGFERARAHFNEQELIALGVYPDHYQRLEPPLLRPCVLRWARFNRRPARTLLTRSKLAAAHRLVILYRTENIAVLGRVKSSVGRYYNNRTRRKVR